MIRQFRVQNFKALRDVTLDLTPIHVLVGPNNSGKSSILQALRGVCRSVDHPVDEAFAGIWTSGELVNPRSEYDEVSFVSQIEDPYDTLIYRLELPFAFARPGMSWIQETISFSPQQHKPILKDFQGADRTVVCSGITDDVHGKIEGDVSEMDAAIRRLQYALGPVAFVAYTPHHLAVPSALKPQRGYRLEPSGFGLPALLDLILSENRARFDALEERLKSIFPEIESIQLPQSDAYDAPVDPHSMVLELRQTVSKELRFRFKGLSQPVSASQVSDGILYVLGYLAYLYSPEAPRVLLIEEPENGLHPERLSEIVKILRELVAEHPETQILMTTHAPYLVDEFQPEEVTVCYRDGEGDAKVKRLDRSPLVERQRKIFNLGEIWAAEGEKALIENPQEVPG